MAGTDQNTKQLYEFGSFRVDAEKELLLREDETVPLAPKAFQILLVLIRSKNEVVTKDELMRAVWPDTFVEEANISRNIFLLRKALGDSPQDHQYVVTVPGRGYRFTEEVQFVPEQELSIVAASHAKVQVEVKESNRWPWLAIAAVVLVALTAGAVSLFLHRQPVLTEKDTVVLSDFVNSTGDPVFDGTLRQGLSVQLEQSPFLSVASEGRIQQTLKLMGQPADAKLTPPIGRELCQRAGGKAVLDGSIAQIGTKYLLTLKAINCLSGETLASAEAEASDKNHVLDALGKTASEMRNKLGESLSTVKRFDTPLEQATTGSLEALQAYSLGRRASAGGDWAAAVPFYRRAVYLDPKFAMAYARLGMNYRNLGETALGFENSRRAYELRDQVSELEKFYIESHYYIVTVGDLDKALQVCEIWAQTYPRDWTAHADLTDAYQNLGEIDKALPEARETVRLGPTAVGYHELFVGYLHLNRFSEAWSVGEEAQARNLDSPVLHSAIYRLAFLRNDAAGMAQQIAWGTGKPGTENMFLSLEADTAAYSGRLRQARELSLRAVDSAKRAEETEVAAEYEANAALREALFGNSIEDRGHAADELDSSKGPAAQFLTALALAFAGEARRAGVIADDLGNRFPENTLVQSYYLPTIRAQLALRRNDPARAIEVLKTAAPYELSSAGRMYPVYMRGESYLASHRGNEAAAEFQKILDHRGIVTNAPIGALAHLGLGRAYAMQGDMAKARFEYQDFLTLWKDADQDLPILISAKREYASLR
jgi:DNA-binding winged helix-turn-helix (wHTH) protein/Flp pilus assembly protein TadD